MFESWKGLKLYFEQGLSLTVLFPSSSEKYCEKTSATLVQVTDKTALGLFKMLLEEKLRDLF